VPGGFRTFLFYWLFVGCGVDISTAGGIRKQKTPILKRNAAEMLSGKGIPDHGSRVRNHVHFPGSAVAVNVLLSVRPFSVEVLMAVTLTGRMK
jgi:hypothetical protein